MLIQNSVIKDCYDAMMSLPVLCINVSQISISFKQRQESVRGIRACTVNHFYTAGLITSFNIAYPNIFLCMYAFSVNCFPSFVNSK